MVPSSHPGRRRLRLVGLTAVALLAAGCGGRKTAERRDRAEAPPRPRCPEGRRTLYRGSVMPLSLAAADGDVVITGLQDTMYRVLRLRPAGDPVRLHGEGQGLWNAALHGGVAVFTRADGAVLESRGAGAPRQVARVEGAVGPLAADADAVYLAAGDRLLRVARRDGAVTPLLSGLGTTYIHPVVLVGDHVGVLDDAGAVRAVPRSGGTAATLGQARAGAVLLAASGPRLYFVGDGGIHGVAVGGVAAPVAREPDRLQALAAAGDAVYWLTPTPDWKRWRLRRALRGGAPETLETFRAQTAGHLAATSARVYWAQEQSVESACP